MSEDERFEEWLVSINQRLMPNNELTKIKTLAKEMAEGALQDFWEAELFYEMDPNTGYGAYLKNRFSKSPNFNKYLAVRWNRKLPKWNLLSANQFLERISGGGGGGLKITEKSFHLIQEFNISNVFISYKRKDSSAFALLVLNSLKERGLEAFLDMALVPGEDWQSGLKKRIQGYDYFILLLGKETLSSEIVLDEIGWAMEAGLTIIPVWHNGFEYDSKQWGNIPVKIDQLLSNTHAIRVREESALDYNTAIVELLNRFGVTP